MKRLWRELTEQELRELYAWPVGPWSRLNVVCDAHGSLVGPSGDSNSLTSQRDRWLLKTIRSHADLVIVGAASVRAEGWHIPVSGKIAVVSHGTIDSLPACPTPSRVVVADFDTVAEATQAVDHWLCEGGKLTAEQFIQRGLLDELCVTFAGVGASKELPTLPSWMTTSSKQSFVCVSFITDGDAAFTIWRRG